MILRNAGEYLENVIRNNDNNTINKLYYLLLVLFFLLGIIFNELVSLYVKITTVYVYILFYTSTIFIYYIIKNIIKKNDSNNSTYEKGLIGEKNVAFELSRLQGKYSNFYIINDFQFFGETKTNIDHIIICEKGVFTIETKNLENITETKKNEIIKQARNEAWLLQKELVKDFNIKYVNPISVVANEKFIISEKTYDYIKNNIMNINSIENMLNKKNSTLNSTLVENIFLFLSKKQIS